MRLHIPEQLADSNSTDNEAAEPRPESPGASHDADNSDLDDFDLQRSEADDARWDVFVADEDERDPLPDPSDYWHEFADDD
jgi:hypothetical protein